MSKRYVYIYRASKTAMQSGRALTENWLTEFPRSDSQRGSASATGWRYLPDATMGWYGGGDTQEQLRLSFADLDGALRWANSQGLTPIVRPQQVRKWERQEIDQDANEGKGKGKSKGKSNGKGSSNGKGKIPKKPYGKSYAANFAHDRKVPWTH